MGRLKSDVSEQIQRSVHVKDGHRAIKNGEPTDGYMAELTLRAIGHFKTPDEARYHLLKEMEYVINGLFDEST